MKERMDTEMEHIIRHPKGFGTNYETMFVNNMYIVVGNVEFTDEKVRLDLDHPIVIIGNVKAKQLATEKKLIIAGRLDTDILVANSVVHVLGNINAVQINSSAAIHAISINVLNGITVSSIRCSGNLCCSGNIFADSIQAYCIETMDGNISLTRGMDAGGYISVKGNITAQYVNSHGKIDAKEINVGTASAGLDNGENNIISCNKFAGKVFAGELHEKKPVTISMAEIREKFGISEFDDIKII